MWPDHIIFGYSVKGQSGDPITVARGIQVDSELFPDEKILPKMYQSLIDVNY